VSDLSQTEQAIPFQIPVTWATLVDPPKAAGEPASLAATPRVAAADPSAQWSMVIPKRAAAAPLQLPAAHFDEPARFAAPRYVVPKFEVRSDSASLAVKLVLSASALLLLVPGWRNTGSPGARAVEAESMMKQRGWIRPSNSLVLYERSIGKTDYKIEFNWPLNPMGVAWVFRAKDKDNYYGVRIKPAAGEPAPMLAVTRFIVSGGIEKSRFVKLLPVPKGDPSVRLKTDVAGSTFKLFLDDKVVSQWTDGKLPMGAVGFLEQGNQGARVQSLKISLDR